MKALALAVALSALTTAGAAGDHRQQLHGEDRASASAATLEPGLALALLGTLLLVPGPLSRAMRRREQARRATALASTLASH